MLMARQSRLVRSHGHRLGSDAMVDPQSMLHEEKGEAGIVSVHVYGCLVSDNGTAQPIPLGSTADSRP